MAQEVAPQLIFLSSLMGAGSFGVSNEHDDSTDECRRALASFPNNIWDWEKSFQ